MAAILLRAVLSMSAATVLSRVTGLARTLGEIKGVDGHRLLRSLLKIPAAGFVMYVVARAGTHLLGTGSTAFGRAVVLVVAGGGSLCAYLAAAALLKIEELNSIFSSLKRRRSVG